jgi:HlyD family secretion protein
MRFVRAKYIVPAVLVGLVVLVVWSLKDRAVEVDTARVTQGSVRSYVEEDARTRAAERYTLSSPVNGRLLRVGVRAGDPVTQGQVLARIDPLELRSRVEQTRSRLRELTEQAKGIDRKRPKAEQMTQAKLLESVAEESLVVSESEHAESRAALTKAQNDEKRDRRLRETGAITPGELEDSELALTRAREAEAASARRIQIRKLEVRVASLASAILVETGKDFDWEKQACRERIKAVEADLEVLEDDLGRVEIVAPIDGVVLRRYHESETVVAAGAPVLEIGDIRRLEVEADVLSEDAALMRVGQHVEVFGRALDDRVVAGKITRIHGGAFRKISSLGVEQQRVTIVAGFDPGDVLLGDGYRVDLRVIFDERRDVLLVPEGALFRRGGRWSVFRVENGRIQLTRVETGLGDGREREILEGLSANDEVVLHPENGLTEGKKVEPR